MISDDPAKGLGLAGPETLLFPKLRAIIGESAAEVYMESPYLVPTAAEFDEFVAVAERGVKIKVLTNSLQSTDVPIVTLYELRRLSPDTAPRKSAGALGGSGSSLHAKAFSIDNSRIFIGSFNFDPRSSTLNTEMGFVIESPALANRMEAVLSSRFLASAYEVRLSDARQLYWIERREGKWVRHDTEPGASFWKRLEVWLTSMLPIEWLL
jgi:putative cardiolipin synthase